MMLDIIVAYSVFIFSLCDQFTFTFYLSDMRRVTNLVKTSSGFLSTVKTFISGTIFKMLA